MDAKLAVELAATWELCGGNRLSEAAVKLLVTDLRDYPEAKVRAALRLCRQDTRRISVGLIHDTIRGIKNQPAKPVEPSRRLEERFQPMPAGVRAQLDAFLGRIARRST